MTMTFHTRGTCSQQITIDLDGDIIKTVHFNGGCHGNLQGISRLVTGLNIRDVIDRLQGIKCGRKDTSCPDQLSVALKSILEKRTTCG